MLGILAPQGNLVAIKGPIYVAQDGLQPYVAPVVVGPPVVGPPVPQARQFYFDESLDLTSRALQQQADRRYQQGNALDARSQAAYSRSYAQQNQRRDQAQNDQLQFYKRGQSQADQAQALGYRQNQADQALGYRQNQADQAQAQALAVRQAQETQRAQAQRAQLQGYANRQLQNDQIQGFIPVPVKPVGKAFPPVIHPYKQHQGLSDETENMADETEQADAPSQAATSQQSDQQASQSDASQSDATSQSDETSSQNDQMQDDFKRQSQEISNLFEAMRSVKGYDNGGA